MINVIVPIIDKKMKFGKILSKLKNEREVMVYVGVTEELFEEFHSHLSDSENVSVIKFENASSREGIINALQKYIGIGATLIMRKPITIEEFNQFALSGKDVVTCRVERNKFKTFLFFLWQKFLKMFLGLTQYEGDTSVVYFGEDLSSVVAESGNLSFSSRANRWKGIEQDTIKTDMTKVKAETDKANIIKLSLCASLPFAIALIVTILICCLVDVTIIVGLLIVCLDLICLSISVISLIILIFNLLVGKKTFTKANLIDNVDLEEL